MGAVVSSDLADAVSLATVCEDCGRKRVWRRHEIARAQRIYRVATVVQFGTKAFCSSCKSRGREGRNITVYVNEPDVPTPQGALVDVRPLSALTSATASCSHCGHRKTADKDGLAAIMEKEAKTVDELWRQIVCPTCGPAKGESGMTLEVEPPMVPPSAAAPKRTEWSKAEVFGENRADPFAGLPRSRLMRCG